jgi:hypothetical protein
MTKISICCDFLGTTYNKLILPWTTAINFFCNLFHDIPLAYALELNKLYKTGSKESILYFYQSSGKPNITAKMS